jgi:hypothetical protein
MGRKHNNQGNKFLLFFNFGQLRTPQKTPFQKNSFWQNYAKGKNVNPKKKSLIKRFIATFLLMIRIQYLERKL